jgi:dienelactone hydrolase
MQPAPLESALWVFATSLARYTPGAVLIALMFVFCTDTSEVWADELKGEIATWTKAGMLKGATSTEEQCVRSDRVWVIDKGEGFCIRYFKNNSEPHAGLAIVIFDGDYVGSIWDSRGRPIRDTYGPNIDGKRLFRRTVNHTRKSKTNSVFLVSRPGQLGSSGDHKNKYKRSESRIVNAALDQIRDRYHLEGFVLVGHSGGATLIANLLGKRSDIKCAVMDSGAIALHAYAQDYGFNSTIWALWEDPMDSLEKIPPSATEYYILAGEGDPTRPPKYQKLFADALAQRTPNVHYLLLRKPSDPHNLQDEAIRVADQCASGVSFDKIKKSLKLSKKQ